MIFEVVTMSIQPTQTTIPETTPGMVSALKPIKNGKHLLGGRPFWLMWPSVLLLILIVGIPFLIAFYISFLNLDQYTLRSWIYAPWVGLANYLTALTSENVVGASTLVSLGVSIAFSLLTTLFID